MSEVLLLSSSSIGAFLGCRKSYDLMYEQMLEPHVTSEAAEKGTKFHEHAAVFAQCYHDGDPARWKAWQTAHQDDPMLTVWKTYYVNRWAKSGITPEQIVMPRTRLELKRSHEHPIYLPLVRYSGVDVWVRMTFDLVLRHLDDWMSLEDWKTFSAAPSTKNSDLDFQARFFIAGGMRYYETDRMKFRWRYVRSVPPGTLRGTVGEDFELMWEGETPYKVHRNTRKRTKMELWTVDECYTEEELICSRSESDEMWAEAQDIARDIVRARKERRWYRSPRRGSMPFTCGSCFARDLCKTEMAIGGLDEDTRNTLADPRAPIVVPEEEFYRFRRRPRQKREAA